MQIKPPFSHFEENFPTNIKTQSEINCRLVVKHYFQIFPNISNIKIPGSFYLLSLLNIPQISILYQLSLSVEEAGWKCWQKIFYQIKSYINLIKTRGRVRKNSEMDSTTSIRDRRGRYWGTTVVDDNNCVCVLVTTLSYSVLVCYSTVTTCHLQLFIRENGPSLSRELHQRLPHARGY